MRERSVAAWPMSAKSCASWTEPTRAARARTGAPKSRRNGPRRSTARGVATVRAAACMQKLGELAGNLVEAGNHEEEAWLAGKGRASDPAWSAPCTAPIAPPSLGDLGDRAPDVLIPGDHSSARFAHVEEA